MMTGLFPLFTGLFTGLLTVLPAGLFGFDGLAATVLVFGTLGFVVGFAVGFAVGFGALTV